MPDSQDYRLYLNERFDSITHLMNAHFLNVDERLEKIEIQTTRTNGRVTELEKEVHNELPHTIDTCPQKDVIDKIHKAVIAEEAILKRKESDFNIQHSIVVRWVMIIGILLSVVVSITGMVINHKSTAALKGEVDMINTPVRTRSGVIELWPSGIVVDSLNKADNGKD